MDGSYPPTVTPQQGMLSLCMGGTEITLLQSSKGGRRRGGISYQSGMTHGKGRHRLSILQPGKAFMNWLVLVGRIQYGTQFLATNLASVSSEESGFSNWIQSHRLPMSETRHRWLHRTPVTILSCPGPRRAQLGSKVGTITMNTSCIASGLGCPWLSAPESPPLGPSVLLCWTGFLE